MLLSTPLTRAGRRAQLNFRLCRSIDMRTHKVVICNMAEKCIDSVMYLLLSMLAIFISALLLVLIEFNATYIFPNAGVVGPTTQGLSEWFTYAATHPEQLRACLKRAFFGGLLLKALFCAPAIAVLASWGYPQRQFRITMTLFVLGALELLVLVQFYGYNSANGGYDGGEGLVLLLSHCLFGLLTTSFAFGTAVIAFAVHGLRGRWRSRVRRSG